MGHSIRIAADHDDVARVVAVDYAAFGMRPPATDATAAERIDPARTYLAELDGRDAGATSSYAFDLTTPGGTVASAGVTLVGVASWARGRGLLRALMQDCLGDARRRGEAVAVLFSSEWPIYGRFGFAPAIWRTDWDLDLVHARLAVPVPDGTWEPVPFGRAAAETCGPVYDAVRTATPGMVDRSPAWWEWYLADGDDPVPLTLSAHRDRDGVVDAYLATRMQADFADTGIPQGAVEVVEALAVGPDAAAALWAHAGASRLADRLHAMLRPTPDPIELMLVDARRLRRRRSDAVWLRILDLPAALAARRSPVEAGRAGPIVVGLDDPYEPAHAGAWEIGPDDDGTLRAVRTTRTPQLQTSVDVLAAAYLGGTRIGDLAAAGRIRVGDAAALARLDAFFGWPVTPWCARVF